MITLLARLLGGRTWLAWLIVVGLSVGTLGGLYAWVDHQGYARASAAWGKKYDARETELQAQRFRELDRQATANAEAKAREAERLAAEQQRVEELELLLADLSKQADADPDRDRPGLSAGAVDRINRIR